MLWELFHSRLVWRQNRATKELEVQSDFPSFPPYCPWCVHVLMAEGVVQHDRRYTAGQPCLDA